MSHGKPALLERLPTLSISLASANIEISSEVRFQNKEGRNQIGPKLHKNKSNWRPIYNLLVSRISLSSRVGATMLIDLSRVRLHKNDACH
jgi:hypothetical protein